MNDNIFRRAITQYASEEQPIVEISALRCMTVTEDGRFQCHKLSGHEGPCDPKIDLVALGLRNADRLWTRALGTGVTEWREEMIPARGLLLVRPVDTAETHPGGRILLTADTRERMTSAQCEVIAYGTLAACDDEDCERAHVEEPVMKSGMHYSDLRVHPCAVRVGDWLLVKPRSFLAGPEPERKEWFVHQDDVLAILSEEAL